VTCNKNWTVAPTDWWQQAKDREFELLYGKE